MIIIICEVSIVERHSLNYSEIGKRIRELRKSKNLTQEQVADLIAVSDNHVSKIETGNSSISLNVFINIAKSFDVSLDYLMFGELSGGETVNDIIIKTILNDFTDEQKDFVIYFLKGIQLYSKDT
jgi:transcriptional regulator with XRE-family HTH domain